MIRYDEALKLLEEHLVQKNRSKYTIQSYINDLRQLVAYLGSRDYDAIEKVPLDVLNDFKTHLNTQKYSVKSISRKVNSVRLLFRFLNKQGLIPENTAKDLSHPKFRNAPPRVLSQTEYRAIRDASASDTKLYSIIEILLQTGLRVGELVRLKVSDFKDSSPKPSLFIDKYQSQPERNVQLNNKSYTALKRWLSVRPEVNSDYIYITRTAKPIIVRNLRTSLLRIFKKAGVENATVNDLRNTYIAYCLANKVPKEKVAEIVGHKNLSTTDRYKNLMQVEEPKAKDIEL
ncbi:tyrosine-type recombinase/integrase [Candidatus Dojkabacteria bacterium]|nr:tyrosine-type recombinase/integrase [Candidatus Dojkabacteria bacterium]